MKTNNKFHKTGEMPEFTAEVRKVSDRVSYDSTDPNSYFRASKYIRPALIPPSKENRQ